MSRSILLREMFHKIPVDLRDNIMSITSVGVSRYIYINTVNNDLMQSPFFVYLIQYSYFKSSHEKDW